MFNLVKGVRLQMAVLTLLYAYPLQNTSIEHELLLALYRDLSSTGPDRVIVRLLVAFSEWRVARDRSL